MWPQRSISQKRHVVRKSRRLTYKLRGRRVKFTKERIDKKEEATITKTMSVEVISAEETETEEEILIIKKKRRASNSVRNLLSSLALSQKRQQLWKTKLNPTVKSPTTVWQRLQRVYSQNDRPGRTSIAKIRILMLKSKVRVNKYMILTTLRLKMSMNRKVAPKKEVVVVDAEVKKPTKNATSVAVTEVTESTMEEKREVAETEAKKL